MTDLEAFDEWWSAQYGPKPHEAMRKAWLAGVRWGRKQYTSTGESMNPEDRESEG